MESGNYNRSSTEGSIPMIRKAEMKFYGIFFLLFSFFKLRRILFIVTFLLLIALSPMLSADSIVLKDGTHLTGTVTQLAGGKLSLTTTFAGAISIAWDDVIDGKLDKPLLLVLPAPDAQLLSITAFHRNGSSLDVATAAGARTIPAASFITLRTDAAQKAYLTSLHPGWMHAWSGSANVNLALARGNSNITTLGSGINFTRHTRTDKSLANFSSLYTHDGILNSTTANTINAGVRYDHDLEPHLFVYAKQDFATDALQDLSLRTVSGGGFGWHAIAVAKQQLDIMSGLVWTHEHYSAIAASATEPSAVPAEINNFVALDFGEQYTRKFGGSSSFTEEARYYPDMNQLGQYRVTVNSTLDTHINHFLSWQTTLNEVDVTNPPPGTKNNDIILTTGLGISFARK